MLELSTRTFMLRLEMVTSMDPREVNSSPQAEVACSRGKMWVLEEAVVSEEAAAEALDEDDEEAAEALDEDEADDEELVEGDLVRSCGACFLRKRGPVRQRVQREEEEEEERGEKGARHVLNVERAAPNLSYEVERVVGGRFWIID